MGRPFADRYPLCCPEPEGTGETVCRPSGAAAHSRYRPFPNVLKRSAVLWASRWPAVILTGASPLLYGSQKDKEDVLERQTSGLERDSKLPWYFGQRSAAMGGGWNAGAERRTFHSRRSGRSAPVAGARIAHARTRPHCDASDWYIGSAKGVDLRHPS